MTDEGRKLIVFGHKKAADGSWETGIHYAEVDPDDHLAGGTVETEAEVDAHLYSGLEPPYHVFDEKDQARLLTGLCEKLHREADAYEDYLTARAAEDDDLPITRQIQEAIAGGLTGSLRSADGQVDVRLSLNGSGSDNHEAEPAEEPSFLRGPQTEYLVRWEMKVKAPTSEKAATRARAIYSRPWNESTTYDVFSDEGNHDRVEVFKDGKKVTEPVGKVDEGKAEDQAATPPSEAKPEAKLGEVQNYLVMWEMDFDATSPEEAAREALEVHRDESSIATVFDVFDENGEPTRVDLLALDEEAASQAVSVQPERGESAKGVQ